MPKVKIGKKHQVTIPKEVFEELDLKEGEYVEVKAEEGKVVLIPQETIPRDQAWFWKEDWQKKEREADEDITNGELEGPFNSADEAIQALKEEE
jgi:AbrB family looped-hinge helix DNA binding protein